MSPDQELEKFVAAQNANTEAAIALMRSGFEGVQRLAELNLATTRELFDRSVLRTYGLLDARSLEDVAAVGSQFAQPGYAGSVEYFRKSCELIARVQQDIAEVMDRQVRQIQDAVDERGQSASAGNDVRAVALRAMLEQTSAALEVMASVARRFATIAEMPSAAPTPPAAESEDAGSARR